MIRSLLLLPLLVAAAGPQKLARTFKADEKTKYDFSVGNEELSIKSVVSFDATNDKGGFSVSAPEMKMTMGGNEQTVPFEPTSVTLDPNNLAQEYEFNETQIPLIMPCLAGFLPNKEIEAGKEFVFEEKRKNFKVSGKGTYKAPEGDGKTFEVTYTMEVAPESDTPANLVYTSTFDSETGRLMKSEGKLDLEGQTMKFSVKRI